MEKIQRMCLLLLMLFPFWAVFMSIQPAQADIYGVPAPLKCSGSTQNGWEKYSTGSCWWTASAQSDGINVITIDTTFTESSVSMYAKFETSYVPYTGNWKLRTYLCSTTKAKRCSVKESSSYIDSVVSVNLKSTTPIVNQNPHFGGAAGTIPANSSLCYAFVDTEEPNQVWTTEAPRTCSDGNILPEEPAVCYINYGHDLDINFGDIDRKNIAVTPTTGTEGNIKKTISILCTRDAAITAKVHFKFTGLSVSGKQVISTSTDNLGVAVFYGGKIMSPSDSVTETFEKGYTNKDLEFEAVHDSKVSLRDIPTGEFTANAIMVITEL